MRVHRKLALGAALVALVSAVAACGSNGSSASGDGPIKIGTIGAFSGPNASTGDANQAVLAYFRHLDDQGGIHGRKIQVVKADDQYNPSLSPGVARKIAPQVVAFCGNNGTDENVAMQSLFAQMKIPNIAPATGATALSKPVSDTQFLVVPDYSRLAAGLIDYAVQKLHKKRIALIYQNDSAGAPVLDGAKKETRKLGVRLVAHESYSATATTMTSQVQKVKAANPDFVFANSVTGAFALIVNAARSIGLDTTWGNLFYGATPQFVHLTHGSTAGRTYVAGFVNAPSDPKAKAAMKVVHSMFSSIDEQDTHAMQGWTLARACAAVIKKTMDAGQDPTPANLIKTMNGFTLDDAYVHGLKWTPKSHAGVRKYQVLKQQGGTFVPVTDFVDAPDAG